MIRKTLLFVHNLSFKILDLVTLIFFYVLRYKGGFLFFTIFMSLVQSMSLNKDFPEIWTGVGFNFVSIPSPPLCSPLCGSRVFVIPVQFCLRFPDVSRFFFYWDIVSRSPDWWV